MNKLIFVSKEKYYFKDSSIWFLTLEILEIFYLFSQISYKKTVNSMYIVIYIFL